MSCGCRHEFECDGRSDGCFNLEQEREQDRCALEAEYWELYWEINEREKRMYAITQLLGYHPET